MDALADCWSGLNEIHFPAGDTLHAQFQGGLDQLKALSGKALAAETFRIVQRHIGELRAVGP